MSARSRWRPALSGDAGAASQGFDGHFVQALALLAGGLPQSFVEIVRNVADGILHAHIIGIAGR